jgi:hypothetical protein
MLRERRKTNQPTADRAYTGEGRECAKSLLALTHRAADRSPSRSLVKQPAQAISGSTKITFPLFRGQVPDLFGGI